MSMQEIAYLLRIPQRKPWGKMADNASAVSAIAKDRLTLLAGVTADRMNDAYAIADDLDEVWGLCKQRRIRMSNLCHIVSLTPPPYYVPLVP
jgi:hypothetical protein